MNTSAFGTLYAESTAGSVLVNNLIEQNLRIANENNMQAVPNPVSNGSATTIIKVGSETGTIKSVRSGWSNGIYYPYQCQLRIPSISRKPRKRIVWSGLDQAAKIDQ